MPSTSKVRVSSRAVFVLIFGTMLAGGMQSTVLAQPQVASRQAITDGNLQPAVDQAHASFKLADESRSPDYIRVLAKLPLDLFTIVPGRFGIVAHSPPLDEAGNSVRASHAIHGISCVLDIGLFGPSSE